MNNPDTPTMASKRWLQIHLSTAIVLMISAGGLLGVSIHYTRAGTISEGGSQYVYDAGWPLYSSAWHETSIEGTGNTLGFNILFNATTLLFIAVSIEHVIRRRERKCATNSKAPGLYVRAVIIGISLTVGINLVLIASVPKAWPVLCYLISSINMAVMLYVLSRLNRSADGDTRKDATP